MKRTEKIKKNPHAHAPIVIFSLNFDVVPDDEFLIKTSEKYEKNAANLYFGPMLLFLGTYWLTLPVDVNAAARFRPPVPFSGFLQACVRCLCTNRLTVGSNSNSLLMKCPIRVRGSENIAFFCCDSKNAIRFVYVFKSGACIKNLFYVS